MKNERLPTATVGHRYDFYSLVDIRIHYPVLEVDLAAGIMLNMLYSESAVYAAAGRAAWNFIDDMIVGLVVSGIIQIMAGFGILLYGALLGLGLIAV